MLMLVIGYVVRRPAEQAVDLHSTLGQANTALTTAEHAIMLWQQTGEELNALTSQNKAILRQLEKSNTNIRLLEESLLALRKTALESKFEIDSLRAMLKTELPEDFEECIGELELAHTVIDAQDMKIQTLHAINTEQGLIIEQKDVIIALKDDQLAIYQNLIRQYRLRMGIVTAVSIAGWLLILL